MVFKTIINFICELYRFYPVLPMGKSDCFTQFYPILPNWFYPLGKTYMPNPALDGRSVSVLTNHLLSRLPYGGTDGGSLWLGIFLG